MTEVFNFEKYQIPHTGVDSTTKGIGTQTRDLNMVISNFGAMNVGNRMSSDYTRTVLSFEFKDEISHWATITDHDGIGQNVNDEAVHNPLVWGSTVKYTRDDQFVRMGMATSIGSDIDEPAHDVMDEKQSTAAGIVATSNATIKNWPAEGWRSYGGKYDFPGQYAGGVLK